MTRSRPCGSKFKHLHLDGPRPRRRWRRRKEGREGEQRAVPLPCGLGIRSWSVSSSGLVWWVSSSAPGRGPPRRRPRGVRSPRPGAGRRAPAIGRILREMACARDVRSSSMPLPCAAEGRRRGAPTRTSREAVASTSAAQRRRRGSRRWTRLVARRRGTPSPAPKTAELAAAPSPSRARRQSARPKRT